MPVGKLLTAPPPAPRAPPGVSCAAAGARRDLLHQPGPHLVRLARRRLRRTFDERVRMFGRLRYTSMAIRPSSPSSTPPFSFVQVSPPSVDLKMPLPAPPPLKQH